MTLLHLGCGDVYLKDYINCDIDGFLVSEVSQEELKINTTTLDIYFKHQFGSPRRKIICDKHMNLLDFPWNFKDESIDKIVMISCIEHFIESEALQIMEEMKRILKVGGEIVIDIPDLKRTVELYYDKNPHWAIKLIYCNQKNPFSFHKFGYTNETFRKLWNINYTIENKVLVEHSYPVISFLITKIHSDYYSQDNEEDRILKYLSNVKKGTYMDIGCAGAQLSNTLYLYKLGWRGLIIDPGLEYREGFKETRPEDLFLPIAITDYDGEVEMCDAATVGSWIGDKYKYEEGLADKVYKAECMTISTLLDHYPKFKEVDFLNIDIESNEDKVLSKCDFNIFKPKLICIEYKIREIDMRYKWEHYLLPFYELKELLKGTSNAFYYRKVS